MRKVRTTSNVISVWSTLFHPQTRRSRRGCLGGTSQRDRRSHRSEGRKRAPASWTIANSRGDKHGSRMGMAGKGACVVEILRRNDSFNNTSENVPRLARTNRKVFLLVISCLRTLLCLDVDSVYSLVSYSRRNKETSSQLCSIRASMVAKLTIISGERLSRRCVCVCVRAQSWDNDSSTFYRRELRRASRCRQLRATADVYSHVIGYGRTRILWQDVNDKFGKKRLYILRQEEDIEFLSNFYVFFTNASFSRLWQHEALDLYFETGERILNFLRIFRL